MAEPPFGRLLSAMATPFDDQGALDLDRAGELATWLISKQANDGLVLNGTGGEAPTTSDGEKAAVIAAVREAVGPEVPLVAGVGTFNTAHSITLAEQAAEAGADGLLVVSPYYSKPPQDGLRAHFRAVADATDLPVLIYDIPARTGVEVTEESLLALAEHPRIVGVKDSKGDLASSARVIARTGLAYYSGQDDLTLPMLSIGAVGVVGTSSHFTGVELAAMIAAHLAGDNASALAIHRRVEPVLSGVFATQGCLLVKAGLERKGLIGSTVRLPLLNATADQVEVFFAQLDELGL